MKHSLEPPHRRPVMEGMEGMLMKNRNILLNTQLDGSLQSLIRLKRAHRGLTAECST